MVRKCLHAATCLRRRAAIVAADRAGPDTPAQPLHLIAESARNAILEDSAQAA
jgi:hypothetical protein